MSAALHLAGKDDLDRVLGLVASYHAFENIEQSDAARQNAVRPLLQGSPHGAIWLIGPRKGPVGYIAITFGWSIEMGGMDGFIDEFFIRNTVRGRGMGGEVLAALLPQLADAGVKALHLEVGVDNSRAEKFYSKHHFKRRSAYNLMTWLAESGPSE